ncbi:MAG: SUMF1/EgtB/PvdO family nonheme iron enzyme [Planctomycetes bacterium]|nr:SUMF1/EgtB/PvdO family nonheme iron enzyme [Planctomycetota bacterium]
MTNPPTPRSIFLRAIELPDDQRRSFLDSACGGDALLRAEVEALLDADGRASGFLRPGQAAALLQAIGERPGVRIGRYRLIEILGEGGFGVVFRAEQEEPIRRPVALKVIRPGMDSASVIARFEIERQALARMNHPSIARILDAGTTEGGRPYFVMELVDGVPITAFCSARGLPLPARLELFGRVCDAVQHAHQRGVIHRDLKPSNVLVADGDLGPVPVVIDFGIAKAIAGAGLADGLAQTQGAIVGTPIYMSPEQAALGHAEVDTRTDVYSLGALLYELVADAPPRDPERLRSLGLPDLLRVLAEEDPPTPSSRLRGPGRTGAEPRLVRRELDWIVMRAIDRDRDRRYASAADLARDVGRYRRNEPVEAGPRRLGYVATKFVRRHRVAVATTAVVVVALVVATIVSVTSARAADRQADLAQTRLRDVLDLSQTERLEVLEQTADRELWPVAIDRAPAMEAWLVQAEAFRPRLAELAVKLAALEALALPWTEADQQHDRETHAEWSTVLALEEEIATTRDDDRRQGLRGALALVREMVEARRTWRFADDPEGGFTGEQQRWRHGHLRALVTRLRAFLDGPAVADGVLGIWGFSLPEVRRRLECARTWHRLSLVDPAAQQAWQAAVDYAAQPPPASPYGFALQPIEGLVPLGVNPRTGLLEFWHLPTGARPEPDPDWYWQGSEAPLGQPVEHPNRWQLAAATGAVFVLIPGGTFRMGAATVGEHNLDADALEDEGPVRPITLAPYLLAKYEFTQAQWRRCAGGNPSFYVDDETLRVGPTNPVEQVSWNDCQRFLQRLGLTLPTAAQWERAGRAGTETPWWTGADAATLCGAANLADAAYRRAANDPNVETVAWDDGYAVTAPVGSFRANAFGLHDTVGNLNEWCRDCYQGTGPKENRDGDGLSTVWIDSKYRSYRGGYWGVKPISARVARTTAGSPEVATFNHGCRPLCELSR